MKRIILTLICCLSIWGVSAQNKSFDGLDVHMGNLFRLSDAKTRSICPENFTGEKGKGGMAQVCDRGKRNIANAAYAARDLGEGWKVNPYIIINPKETITGCHSAHLDDSYRKLALLHHPHLLGR